MKHEASTEIEQKRRIALEMGRDEVPVGEIAKVVRVNRRRVTGWLETAGIQPVMLRNKRESQPGVSIRNTPLALSIEESVRKRLEARERRGANAAS